MCRTKSLEWVIYQFLLAAAVLPLASFGDVSSKSAESAPHSADTARLERQRAEAANNYRRGVQFAVGDGVTIDNSKAAECYRKAAEAGYAPAQYQLGSLYEQGLGVACDLKQAAAWYRKAADQGDPEAQNDLGALYAKGQGVPSE